MAIAWRRASSARRCASSERLSAGSENIFTRLKATLTPAEVQVLLRRKRLLS